MVFITFHHDDDEIKLRLDCIMGFTSYQDGSNLISCTNGHTFFVKEDWDYFTQKIKELENIQAKVEQETYLAQGILRKFNGNS